MARKILFFSTCPGAGAAGAADRGATSKSFSENVAFKERPSSASSSPPSAFYHTSLSHQLVSNHVPLYLSFLSRAQNSDVTRVCWQRVCACSSLTHGAALSAVCALLWKKEQVAGFYSKIITILPLSLYLSFTVFDDVCLPSEVRQHKLALLCFQVTVATSPVRLHGDCQLKHHGNLNRPGEKRRRSVRVRVNVSGPLFGGW